MNFFRGKKEITKWTQVNKLEDKGFLLNINDSINVSKMLFEIDKI